MQIGRSLALYGGTGSGKTTQIGELAKWHFNRTGKKTLLRSVDPGGYDTIEHLIGDYIDLVSIGPDDNPWVWIGEQCVEEVDPDVYALVANDSATGMGDMLLKDAAKLAAKNIQVGQQKVFNLKIPGTGLVIGANNESQYGLIQTHMLDQIGKQSRLTEKGIDVLWTFADHIPDVSKGETPIIGPKLVGKALTQHLPRYMRYTLRLVKIAGQGTLPAHRLLTAPQLDETTGMECLVNPRFPLNGTVPQPAFIEPASISEFWELIEAAKRA